MQHAVHGAQGIEINIGSLPPGQIQQLLPANLLQNPPRVLKRDAEQSLLLLVRQDREFNIRNLAGGGKVRRVQQPAAIVHIAGGKEVRRGSFQHLAEVGFREHLCWAGVCVRCVE